MLGYTIEEIKLLGFEKIIHPDEIDKSRESVSILAADEAGFCRMEKRYIHRNGNYLWIDETISLMHDQAGETPYLLTSILDITERKGLQEQLYQAAKMEAIGKLAGGVAHDFNNALTPLLTISGILLETLNKDNPVYNDIVEIEESGRRCANLTRQLLAFGRKQPMEFQTINLNDVINNLEKMLYRVIGENIRQIKLLDQDLGSVKADAGQIEQIIINLVINARDAMPDGGKLTIETRNLLLEETLHHNAWSIKPGEYILLIIADTGKGMDENTLQHIFEPFYTTKIKGKGTGLGLSSVYGIVKQSRGYILAESEAGNGSSFKIFLPLVKEDPEEIKPLQTVLNRSSSGTETILIVEDEEKVLETARNILAGKGYTILESANGEDALCLISKYKNPVHLLLTDVIMPGINGFELAQTAIKKIPGLKVLLFSGYIDEVITREDILKKGLNFIQKPFTSATLCSRVRESLDQ